MRIENVYELEILDQKENYTIKLSPEYLAKFKFIYIKKHIWKKGNPYIATYSNTLYGFM